MSAQKASTAPGAFLCTVPEVPDGGCHGVVLGEGREELRILLIRRGETVWAYRNRCPHFSLPLDYEPQRFHVWEGDKVVCAHHGAVFRFEDGSCLEGPCAGAGLDPLPVRREGDELLLDEGPGSGARSGWDGRTLA